MPRRLPLLILLASAALLLAGCGMFGCASASSNGGFFAGCGAGVRF